MKSFTDSYSIYKPYASMQTKNKGTALEYKEGRYVFANGQVDIYSEGDYISLSIVYNGKDWRKNISEIKKPITDRMLVRQAGIFAKEVVG